MIVGTAPLQSGPSPLVVEPGQSVSVHFDSLTVVFG